MKRIWVVLSDPFPTRVFVDCGIVSGLEERLPGGVEAILVQADMGQDADCRKLAAETLKKWGRIDGLINNAGTTKFQNQGDLDGVTPEDFDRILRVNVTGPYMMSRAVFPTMKKQWEDKQERGAIVNIS